MSHVYSYLINKLHDIFPTIEKIFVLKNIPKISNKNTVQYFTIELQEYRYGNKILNIFSKYSLMRV